MSNVVQAVLNICFSVDLLKLLKDNFTRLKVMYHILSVLTEFSEIGLELISNFGFRT